MNRKIKKMILLPYKWLLRKYKKYQCKKNIDNISKIYRLADGVECEQALVSNCREIVFVLPLVSLTKSSSGGITSILRLGSGLFERGYNVKYLSASKQKKAELSKGLKLNFDYKGETIDAEDLNGDNRFVCATSFDSVFFAIKISGYKMYFVQDFEPFFFPVGDQWYLAEKTYNLGLHLISLGKWNLSMANKFCRYNNSTFYINNKMSMDYIEFPFEPKEFSINKKDFNYLKKQKLIRIAVYIRSSTERRMSSLIRFLTYELAKCFNFDGIGLKFYYFGDNIKYDNVVNLGVLSREKMKDLFSNCDFGMCMSGTNVSLVPYEMIAMGLPLIDFENSSLKDFLNDGVFYYSGNAKELYEQIKLSLNNPKILENKMSVAQSTLKELSWEKSIDQFDEILKKVNGYSLQ